MVRTLFDWAETSHSSSRFETLAITPTSTYEEYQRFIDRLEVVTNDGQEWMAKHSIRSGWTVRIDPDPKVDTSKTVTIAHPESDYSLPAVFKTIEVAVDMPVQEIHLRGTVSAETAGMFLFGTMTGAPFHQVPAEICWRPSGPKLTIKQLEE